MRCILPCFWCRVQRRAPVGTVLSSCLPAAKSADGQQRPRTEREREEERVRVRERERERESECVCVCLSVCLRQSGTTKLIVHACGKTVVYTEPFPGYNGCIWSFRLHDPGPVPVLG